MSKSSFKLKSNSVLIILFLMGCQSTSANSKMEMEGNNKKNSNEHKMEFECVIESTPEFDHEINKLYDYAQYHDFKENLGYARAYENDSIRFYRIAMENGDYRATERLKYLSPYNSDLGMSSIVYFIENLKTQRPSSYYYSKSYPVKRFGKFNILDDGYYGLSLKSAQLGNAKAQFDLSNSMMKLNDVPKDLLEKVSNDLLKCSSENGYAIASVSYGEKLQSEKKYKDALEVFQRAVEQGDPTAALILFNAYQFDAQLSSTLNSRSNLALAVDHERARRFQIILNALVKYKEFEPKVPDLNDIVPLPPAKLPAWDGKIAFQRWYEGPSPEKPSDALVEKLAQAKGLDPKTGQQLKN